MPSLLLLDLDGTVREPLDGRKFIQRPRAQRMDGRKFIQRPRAQRIIAKAEVAIAYYDQQSWKIVGITNQAGVATGKKSLQNCLKEQEYTLTLLPEIEEIYFCPDFEGTRCFCVTRNEVKDYSHYPQSGTFRKPGAGMLNLAIQRYQPDTTFMVGDSPEDRAAALAAGIRFQQAQSWRQNYGDATYTQIELGKFNDSGIARQRYQNQNLEILIVELIIPHG